MRASLAALVLTTLLAAPSRAASLDAVWAGTNWGEAPEALQRQLGARAYAPLVMRGVGVGGYPLIVYYQIDKATHGLKRIQLELPRHRVNAAAFRGIFLALDDEYGAPDQRCGTLPGPTTAYQGTAQYVWTRNGVVIRAIFRDTTLQAFGGCYSPACGLTAQLLLRISPPAEDGATCPPLPTSVRP